MSEHQVEQVACSTCQYMSHGRFPAEVAVVSQYGQRPHALAVYLHRYQLIPSAYL